MRSTWVGSLALASVVVALPLAACGNGSDAAPSDKPEHTGSARPLAGVYPDKFKCDSILTTDALGQLLGGTAHPLDSALSMPRGLASPCAYQLTTADNVEYWTFDFDCRDGMKQRADALFAQYKATSAELVEAYNGAADAQGGIKPTDAGVVAHAPDPAIEVDVGAKALDHHGQGLLFIDDDAPCYVRVVGPDAARRLALAKAIAKNLTFQNAPMTPRPLP